ncbi:tetraspanin-like protein, partial [Leptotrombidium deliense]
MTYPMTKWKLAILIMNQCLILGCVGVILLLYWVTDLLNETGLPIIYFDLFLVFGLMMSLYGILGNFEKYINCLLYIAGTVFLVYVHVLTIILVIDKSNNLIENIDLKYFHNMKHYNILKSSKTFIDESHSHFECCGAEKPFEWLKVLNDTEYPSSCCVKSKVVECKKPYKDGCTQKIKIKLDKLKIYIIVSIL